MLSAVNSTHHDFVRFILIFATETHDGVQDMACDTFIKIAQKCRRHFVQVQVGEVMPFIDEILNNINTIICDLQPQQVSPASQDLTTLPDEFMCCSEMVVLFLSVITL